MKRYFVLIIAVLFVISGCSSGEKGEKMPKAENGFLDLSQWDFGKDGIIKLNGEWEFYWMKLYTPADFDTVKANPEYINQPTNWIAKKINGKNLPNFGYATYRLKIKLNPKFSDKDKFINHLRLKLIEAHSASKVWIGKQPLFSNGEIAAGAENFKPKVKPESAAFYNTSDTLTVVINVANYFDTYMSGIDDNILLGTDYQISQETKNNEFLYLISFSVLLILCFYHLVIYVVRPKEIINLFFSAACFVFALQSFVVGEKTIYFYFPNISTQIYYKIWLSTLIIFSLLPRFYRELFPDEIKNSLLKINDAIFGLYFLIVIFTKHSFYISLESYLLYYGFFMVFYLIYCVILAVKNRRKYSVAVLIFMTIPFITAINDMLFGLDLIVTGYYGPIGFLILMVSHSFLVTVRMAHSFEKAEVLGDELRNLNKTLEQKVEERTAELNSAYNELKATNAAKNKIFSIISHDLKNIFHTMIGYSDLIVMDTAEADLLSTSKDAETIKKTAKNAYLFFENMLEWSGTQTGMIKYHPEILNLKQSAFECLELLSIQAKAKKLVVSVSVDSELEVKADKRMLNTILRNLISNAVKFTHRGGKISIQASAAGDMAQVRVTDSGIGMDEETLSELFIMDRMTSKKGTASENGTGLGLQLVKEFIEINKGRLEVTSQKGEGSTFIFTLPLSKNKKNPKPKI